MFKKVLMAKPWVIVYANDLDAFVPEVWAQEGLLVLESNLVAAQLVYRDFENEIAQFGDVVNTRRPASFNAVRKVDTDPVTVQDAIATNVQVPMNQFFHTSFKIYDGEESKGFKNLRDEYLVPAVKSLAQAVDQALLCQVYGFLANVVGKLGTDPTKTTILSVRDKFNTNKVPIDGNWNFLVTPGVEATLLDIADFVSAEKIGDQGTALREGSLGRKFGFNFFMSQNLPVIATGNTVVTGAVNLSAGYAAGSTTIAVDGLSAAITAGSWCTIGGDMTPQMITGSVGGATPSSITISPGLRNAVVNDAVVTIYTPGASNYTAGNAAGWTKALTVDGFSVAPKSGQLVSFGTTAHRYGAIGTPTTTSLTLDRELQAAIANNDVVGIGPAGDYCLAMHKNAIAFVSRPLAQPARGTGALSSVVNYNGLSIRVTITYDGTYQAHLVTVDLLGGIKLLDANLGCIMLA